MDIRNGVLLAISPKEHLLIPRVRALGAGVLRGSRVKSVVIPGGVEEIRERAFENCAYLESVELPSSLRRIGDAAFLNTGIRKIELPRGVELGDSVFGPPLAMVVSDVRIPLSKLPDNTIVVPPAFVGV